MLSDGRDEKESKDGQDSDWIGDNISKDVLLAVIRNDLLTCDSRKHL